MCIRDSINNILAALTARKYKMDVSQVVVVKTDVSEMVRTSNARDFGLSEILEYFEQVLRICLLYTSRCV